MMTTSYPHGAGMQPQGMPHGHPMGGPGPQPGQQMPSGMHPGVSGPNGPVNQAGPMMGMPPGMGNPNAHALQHLQPQQAQMFAQQQQQQQQQHPGMMNPAMMQQQQNFQRQTLLRHQHHQAMLAQNGGMAQFQNPMQSLNPQQIATLQAQQAQRMGQPAFGNMPPHLPQAQAAAMAQAHAQQQAQQQHMQQQQQAHQQAQAIAMQQAHSQQSNHSQNAGQGPPTTQPQQGPLRPPSAMSHQGASPAAQATPQQPPPQQQPQPSQQQQQQLQQSGPQPGQQTPAPSQPASLPQQPNQQGPQNPAQMQQRPQQAQAAAAQAQAAHQAQVRNMAMLQQAKAQQGATSGQATLKLLNFVDQIGKYTVTPDTNNIERWQGFVAKFFTETGSFIHCLYSDKTKRTKQFDVVYAALPRYFYTLFNTDVTNLQITLDGSNEKAAPPELKVTCDRAKFVYTYKNQCQVVYNGKLTAFWSNSDKMEWLQFEGESHQQYLPRMSLEALFHQSSPNQMNPNQSPRLNKNTKSKQQRAMEPAEPSLPLSKLPSAGVTEYGLPPNLQHYLEIYETMNNMTGLISHYLEHPNLNPPQALKAWNSMMTASNPNPMPMGMQNPGLPGQPGQMQQPSMQPGARSGPTFMSPAIQNSLLPNGSMTGSPRMMNTPSPHSHQMVKQQSTSSHTASVNTSPNMQNKRRRSTAKIDLDDGEMNGMKVKQSPRVGVNKRMKGGN